eukprot:10032024-Heterocapsa_arctica.AAC.1
MCAADIVLGTDPTSLNTAQSPDAVLMASPLRTMRPFQRWFALSGSSKFFTPMMGIVARSAPS